MDGMREIKFRAWSNRFNRMFRVRELSQERDGYTHGLVDLGFEDEHSPTNEEFERFPELAFMGRVDFVKSANGKTSGLTQNPDDEPCYLMQYTGLKDVHGKEIYEGDVVNTIYDGELFTGVVVYDESELGFKATNGKENYGSNFQYLPCCEEVEIIGNIYENPELLKGVEA